MKTLNLLTLTVVAGSLLTLTAQAGILGSPHDFHSRSWNNDPSDPATVCSVCHTPHHADTVSGPLWGHTPISASGWQMYANGVSPGANIKYTPAAAPTGSSLACLSCHDGSIAVNAYGSVASSEYITNGAAISEGSKNLTHSHPISFNYQALVGTGPTQDKWLNDSVNTLVLTPDANSPGFIAGNDMHIKGFLLDQQGNLECSSCHDVHNQEGSPYNIVNNPHLVKINGTAGGVGSLLCRSCHNK
jgi:hypothetical protein